MKELDLTPELIDALITELKAKKKKLTEKKPHKRKKLVKCLTEEQIKILLRKLSYSRHYVRDRYMMILFLNTGMRVSEMSNLTIKNVANKDWIEIHGKGGVRRDIPLNKNARNAIKNLIKLHPKNSPSAPLVISRQRKKLSCRQIQNIIKKISDKVDFGFTITPHTFRHTFATKLLKKTNNIRLVQMALGHASIQTTQIYTHPQREDIRKGIEKLYE